MTSTTAAGYGYATQGTGDAASLTAVSSMMAGTSQDVFDNVISPGMIPKVADVAGRSAVYPSPEQGDRVFRQNVGYTETYFDVASVSNVGGRATAGWYRTSDWINTNWLATTPTGSTGWTGSASSRYCIVSGWCYGTFLFTRTGGTLTVPVDGDLTNVAVGTITDTVTYPILSVPLGPGAGRIAAGTLASTGLITLTATTPGASIINGDVVTLAGSWPVA